MVIALAIIFTIAALYAVAYPIVVTMRQTAPATTSSEDSLEELLARRDAAFQALRDLNFDHEVGKITDEDYLVFEAGLKQNAADALRAVDAWEAQTDAGIEDVLEQEIAARRSSLGVPGRPCPHCGRPSAARDVFCTGCGRPLAQAAAPVAGKPAAACPQCGHALEPGDRFCPGCGQPVGKRAAVAG
jgi:hypothetical protein